MTTSAPTKDGISGPNTGEIEFHAKSTWIMLRGNRYQVLEDEFYGYVLAPHDDVLKEIYYIGVSESQNKSLMTNLLCPGETRITINRNPLI